MCIVNTVYALHLPDVLSLLANLSTSCNSTKKLCKPVARLVIISGCSQSCYRN